MTQFQRDLRTAAIAFFHRNGATVEDIAAALFLHEDVVKREIVRINESRAKQEENDG